MSAAHDPAAPVMQRFRLDGRVALVTGASSGLGRACASALADAGARVVLGARRVDRLEDLNERIRDAGGVACARRLDVSDPQECDDAAQSAIDLWGRLDVLVNAAGVASAVPASRETPEEFRSVIETNLMGSYWMAQASARRMAPGSSVINVSSVLALTSTGLPQAAYSSSKAAVLALTRDLAQQWGARKGIRVNAVVPGYFPTEMTEVMDPAFLDDLVERRIPLHRLGRVDECAAAVVFLASDAASYVTGIGLPVDGGLLTS